MLLDLLMALMTVWMYFGGASTFNTAFTRYRL